jgi:hypothetical protein
MRLDHTTRLTFLKSLNEHLIRIYICLGLYFHWAVAAGAGVCSLSLVSVTVRLLCTVPLVPRGPAVSHVTQA